MANVKVHTYKGDDHHLYCTECQLPEANQIHRMQHTFTVYVNGCTAEQAVQVMNERVMYDEDYGFEYTISWKGYSDG